MKKLYSAEYIITTNGGVRIIYIAALDITEALLIFHRQAKGYTIKSISHLSDSFLS